jgi:hypothetical protein
MPEKQEDIVKYCTKTFEVLKDIRRPYELEVDEVIKFVNHGRRKITDKVATKGQRTGKDIYDGTAMSAASLASDGIHGYLCSQSIHWFDFTLPGKFNFPRTSGARAWNGKRMDEYPEVKVWLDDCEEVEYSAFERSNFYDVNPSFVREGMTVGTTTDIIEEDEKLSRIVFTLPHFREIYIAENVWGKVDTRYREQKLTLRQLVEKFGYEKMMSFGVKYEKMYNDNPHTELDVLHCCFPRTDYDPNSINGKQRKIASIWILINENKLIEETGYYDNPSVTWRWRKNSDEIYGRSPAWDAMVEIMKAQQQGRSNLIAGHKMVEPPMIVPEDLRGKIRTTPNSQTYVDGIMKDRIPIPMMQGIQLPYGLELQERTDKIIKEYFHTDFFLMLYQAAFNKVDLTATQVIGMQSEQAAVLGTRIGFLQSEALTPIIDRVFEIESRAGRMPVPPDILLELAGGQELTIAYKGPLAQSQKKLFKVQSIQAGLQMTAELSNLWPEVKDKVNIDDAMAEYLDAIGFPASSLNDEETVNQIRAARQKNEEARMTIENMENISKATKNLSKGAEQESPMAALTGE